MHSNHGKRISEENISGDEILQSSPSVHKSRETTSVARKGSINHPLRGSAPLLEAWRLVRRWRPSSASLSINSCFTISLQLSLTRVQICFQLSVTHSAIQALLFWHLISLSLSRSFSPLFLSFAPCLFPFCLLFHMLSI